MYHIFVHATIGHQNLFLAPLITPLKLVRTPLPFQCRNMTINLFLLTDIWSAGCVFAELLLGYPIFSGESGVDQLVEIIKVLGTPSKEQIRRMNRHYTEFKFPKISANPWERVSFTVFKSLI